MKNRALSLVLAAVIFPWLGGAVRAEVLGIVSFNVESGAADPRVLARDVIGPLEEIDLWGFSEVQDSNWARIFEEAAEVGENANFERILGTTGNQDRLLIVYNADKLELVRQGEIAELNIRGRVRAPLWAQFRLRSDGQELIFMVNHLYRGDRDGRHEQARGLNEWARAQTVPVIAVGDYNYDWRVQTGDVSHDRGYDLMIENDVFRWLRPDVLVRTQCDPTFDSVLDFVFVSGAAQSWTGGSEILFRESSYCPDGPTTSDHRPLMAVLTVGGPPPLQVTKEELQRRIEEIERQLAALKELIRDLDCGGN